MKPSTTDDVLDFVDASFASTALGAAMELGLFWTLAEGPRSGETIARDLGIPEGRCGYWLQLLCRLGLLDEGDAGFAPSATARSAILEAYGHDTWALLAAEARQRLPALRDLPRTIRHPGSAFEAIGYERTDYLARMVEDPERARQFTRMLYELHRPLAETLAGGLDLGGARRLMDLGGGSGVMSHALARRHPDLSVTVVDIPTVCAAGREIAAEASLGDRVVYHEADFLRDELPGGFDVVLEADVNVYNEALFRKVRESLSPDGRFVIADQLAPAEGVAPPSRLHWAFVGALDQPDFAFPTVAGVRALLEATGFEVLSERPLAPGGGPCLRFTSGLSVIEAKRAG